MSSENIWISVRCKDTRAVSSENYEHSHLGCGARYASNSHVSWLTYILHSMRKYCRANTRRESTVELTNLKKKKKNSEMVEDFTITKV